MPPAGRRTQLQHTPKFGAPTQLRSDRGSHFVNSVIKEFLPLVGTQHSLTLAGVVYDITIRSESDKWFRSVLVIYVEQTISRFHASFQDEEY
jgi:transposase InsO family protein